MTPTPRYSELSCRPGATLIIEYDLAFFRNELDATRTVELKVELEDVVENGHIHMTRDRSHHADPRVVGRVEPDSFFVPESLDSAAHTIKVAYKAGEVCGWFKLTAIPHASPDAVSGLTPITHYIAVGVAGRQTLERPPRQIESVTVTFVDATTGEPMPNLKVGFRQLFGAGESLDLVTDGQGKVDITGGSGDAYHVELIKSPGFLAFGDPAQLHTPIGRSLDDILRHTQLRAVDEPDQARIASSRPSSIAHRFSNVVVRSGHPQPVNLERRSLWDVEFPAGRVDRVENLTCVLPPHDSTAAWPCKWSARVSFGIPSASNYPTSELTELTSCPNSSSWPASRRLKSATSVSAQIQYGHGNPCTTLAFRAFSRTKCMGSGVHRFRLQFQRMSVKKIGFSPC